MLIEGSVTWRWKKLQNKEPKKKPILAEPYTQKPGVIVCMNKSQHQKNDVHHCFRSQASDFKMLTIHYWHTGEQRGGARRNEIAFPLLSLTISSMRRDQEFRRLSMPAFAEEEDLASFGPSPEGILPATK